MSFSLSAAAAVMLVLCFPGGPSEVPADGQCTTTLDERELAGTVSGRTGADPVLLRRIADSQGQDQRGVPSLGSDKLLGELEREALLGALDPGSASLDTALAPQQTVISSPGGSALIVTDIRSGGL